MPLVSIIVPCYNEEATICLLLEAVYRQTFGSAATSNRDMEVVIADGFSTDGTRAAIVGFQQGHPGMIIRVVDNTRRNIPSGLNRALEAATGRFIIRLDAHSVPEPDYVERCVDNLEAGRGENVGGVWEIRARGGGLVQRAIALAAAHPFGIGDARYRYTTEPGYVDTVPFGAFRREVFERFGCFDESLLSNEDYEFNARLKQGGGRVWLDPRIRTVYFARDSLGALARQYWRYGYWKLRMLQRYPTTLRWRQGLPPVFVLSLLVLLALAPFWSAARALLVVEVGLYFLALAAGSLKLAWQKRSPGLVLAIPLAIATMHFSWAAGFWWSLISSWTGGTK